MQITDMASGLSFLTQMGMELEAEVLKAKYPENLTPTMGLIDSSKNEMVPSIGYRTMDIAGDVVPLGQLADTISNVSLEYALQTVAVQGIGSSTTYTLEEIAQGQYFGADLVREKMAAVRQVVENRKDAIYLIGRPELGFKTGLLNNADVHAETVGQSIGQLADAGDFKAVKAIFAAEFSRIRRATLGIYKPDTVILTPYVMERLQENFIPDIKNKATTVTMLEALQKAFGKAGYNLNFIESYRCEGLGQSKSRIALLQRDRRIIKLHEPMPLKFTAPNTPDGQNMIQWGKVRLGGTEIREPRSMSYIDTTDEDK